MLPKYVDTKVFEVRNIAASGQFAKGFVNAGQFDTIEHYGKKGDYYLIAIGINDTNYSNATEYYNTITDMTKRAKAKGMEVVLIKQQGRDGDAAKNVKTRWFSAELDQVGKEQNVQVVDLFTLFKNYCNSVGTAATTAMYVDGLHVNRAGASKLAELTAGDIDFKVLGGTPVVDPPVVDPPVIDPRPQAVSKGDLNADKVTNVYDLMLLKRYLFAGTELPISNGASIADINADGSIDVKDAQLLQSYLLGKTKLAGANATGSYPAVQAQVNQGAAETTNAGFQSSAYVNLDNVVGSSVTWTVDVAEEGNYELVFHNANGSAADRMMTLTVSGTADAWQVSFPSTNAWTTWTGSKVKVPLKKGVQTITLTSAKADGGPNLDYLTLNRQV